MTWTYEIEEDGGSMKIYDHNDTLMKTIENDGSGFRLPHDIFTVMREEAEKARSNQNTERWRDIHIRLADNDVNSKK